jgi:hypothetical protein
MQLPYDISMRIYFDKNLDLDNETINPSDECIIGGKGIHWI